MRRYALSTTVLAALLTIVLLILPQPAAAQQNPTPTPRPLRGTDSTLLAEDEVDISDWVTLKGDGVAITLPPSFEGGSIDEIIDNIDQFGDMLPDDFDAFMELAQQNPDLYRLYAFDDGSLEDAEFANVNVVAAPLGVSDIPMATLLDLISEQLPASIEIREQDVLELGEYDEVGRFVYGIEIMGQDANVVQYSYLLDGVLYSLTFSYLGGDLEVLLPIFDASAATLEVLDI